MTMNTIKLTMDRSVGYMDAYRAALHAATEAEGNAVLVAWYDRTRKTQGPAETCSDEDWKCALKYAENHDADLRISVNTDQYEFFFSRATGEVAELNEEDLLEVHAGIKADEFSNIQGG
jgi:hypothetical protein